MCAILAVLSFDVGQGYAVSKTAIIDNYIKVTSVTKGKDNKIKVKYTVKKNGQLGTKYTIRSYWRVYSSSKTQKSAALKNKKGTYTVYLKAKSELIGPQYVEIEASVAGGHYIQTKNLKTFYKFPPSKTTTHTLSKKEAIADHIMITTGALSFKLAAKRSPYGIFLNLASYGIAGTYTLKSLNVVGGYPSPAAGQYIRSTTSYSSKGLTLTTKIWTNQKSYKKGLSPVYKYSNTFSWNWR